jgi:hypothetical protein
MIIILSKLSVRGLNPTYRHIGNTYRIINFVAHLNLSIVSLKRKLTMVVYFKYILKLSRHLLAAFGEYSWHSFQ